MHTRAPAGACWPQLDSSLAQKGQAGYLAFGQGRQTLPSFLAPRARNDGRVWPCQDT
eukprot:NODE_14759_length_336_cov_7.745645_g13596_i0.p2 GENE.NODE_14759_length_336_cov_7.745645_g13596_i0~~NODE_14759_length_336_cov_7.745645_g13596_i0.p2  ORF type:complete len:57 (-),score=2.83 NODE_14759_length_336_cov_7.745645_g13596_i0:33-203(-)